MKISKEEKALIKAYVNLQYSKMELDKKDINWLENECTIIIDNRNSDYRFLVDDFIREYINKKLLEKHTEKLSAGEEYRIGRLKRV